MKKAADAHDAAKKELEQVKKDFDAYKSKYKVSIRNRVPGLQLQDFAVAGRLYQGVVAMQFTDEFLGIKHSAGTAKVALADLPEIVQNILGLTGVHDALPDVVAQAAQPVSSSKSREKARLEIDGQLAELSEQSRKIRDQMLVIEKRLRELSIQMSVAKANKRETFAAENEQQNLNLRLNQLEAELVSLDVNRHEVGMKRSNIR